MNFKVGRVFYYKLKNIQAIKILLRLNSTKEPCSSKSSEIKEVKAESSCPQTQAFEYICPPVSPCPPPPMCYPKMSNVVSQSGNPCNYIPPETRDPDYPDLTKLKKRQCRFQEEDHLPMYLRGGRGTVIYYHITVILTIISLLFSFNFVYQLAKN